MGKLQDPVELLLEEWRICDAGIARFDELAFNIRNWVITIFAAGIGAAAAASNALIAGFIVVVVLVCWWNDGVYRTLQHEYLARATDIQEALRESLSAVDPNSRLAEFAKFEDWIGPRFAKVDPKTRGRKAIAHMAWQPHIRWFYAPLYFTGVASLIGLAALGDPVGGVSPPSIAKFLARLIGTATAIAYVGVLYARSQFDRKRFHWGRAALAMVAAGAVFWWDPGPLVKS
jgi:hypothetical protein